MKELEAIDKPIRLVGLTGSIGTGKSTAAEAFRALGVAVIDADELSRAVVEPGRPALAEIVDVFGPELLDEEGRLDRVAISKAVFTDREKLLLLEKIVHPRVAEEARARVKEARERDPGGYVVYDVPLLFEKGMEKGFDLIVTVYASPEEQKRRVAVRSGLALDEIERRMAAQISAAEKCERSHVVLDNSGAKEELAARVGLLAEAIERHNEKFR